MYTKLANTMVQHASKRAKVMIDVHEAFRRANSIRIHDLKNDPAVVMASDGEYRIIKFVGYDVVHVDCATADEACKALEEALEGMSARTGRSAELFNQELNEYFA